MSYRTIKRLLGETSLERKCRFLFGGGLMLLISTSFYFYAQVNKNIIDEQNRKTARLLVPSVLNTGHLRKLSAQNPIISSVPGIVQPLQSDGLQDYQWALFRVDPKEAVSSDLPGDDEGYDALAELRNGKMEWEHRDEGTNGYHYYGAILAERSCVECHVSSLAENWKVGELMAMAKISFPLEPTQRALAKNNAILLATAIVTVFLAMLAAYAIVRYVIVKPVLHLKDVSNEITHGNLDLRANIRTGDEFEELSHAFNRMLRYLTTTQEELRQVNNDLDFKVDELAEVNLRLYELNKIKDEFLTTMSHELRTPLNSILGFSDILGVAENLTEKQSRFVQNIQISGKNLLAIINDVLDLAKIESGKMVRQIVEFRMADLVERQIGALLPLAEKKNIGLTWQVEPDMPPIVQDAGKLQQILNNLLSNAIKFTPEGGRVRVHADLFDERTLQLTVEDTGVGIPLDEQTTIFEKFRQGRGLAGRQDPLTREFEGTGLGLSIVKELCKLLGGEVLLDSEFGKGSTFTVRLPVQFEQAVLLNKDRGRAKSSEFQTVSSPSD